MLENYHAETLSPIVDCIFRLSRRSRLPSLCSRLALVWKDCLAAEEPVAAVGRTRGKRHQADVQFSPRRRTERQLCEVQLTPDCYWAASLLRRLLPCRANWRYRPTSDGQIDVFDAVKRTVVDLWSVCSAQRTFGCEHRPLRCQTWTSESCVLRVSLAPRCYGSPPAATVR